MGHCLTKEGLTPDPMKIKAIVDIPTPDSKKAVEHFLRCLQYLPCFLCQLYEVAAPLQRITEWSAILTWQNGQLSLHGKMVKKGHF